MEGFNIIQKYKLESWTKTKWKGTQREQTTTINRLVKRDNKGHFVSVINDVKEKVYGNTIYYVGYQKGKIKTKKVKQKILKEEQQQKQEKIKELYRTSYVLNNVPISKNGYYGFRIVCISNNKELLFSIKEKMKQRLIKFIEECVKYHRDDFWFDMYFGYEAPQRNNLSMSDNGRYFLTMENKFGNIIKEKQGEIRNL